MQKCFLPVESLVVLHVAHFFLQSKKDLLPGSLLSNVVYNFSCHCHSRYVGRTSQRLQDRIRQHVPQFIRTGQIPNSRNTSTCFCKSSISFMFFESAIGQHLLDNPMCAQYYNDKKFTILSFGRLSLLYLLQKPFTSNYPSQISAHGPPVNALWPFWGAEGPFLETLK